jgi:hypothetical protein
LDSQINNLKLRTMIGISESEIFKVIIRIFSLRSLVRHEACV